MTSNEIIGIYSVGVGNYSKILECLDEVPNWNLLRWSLKHVVGSLIVADKITIGIYSVGV